MSALDDALGRVIDRTALVENLLDQVIEEYVGPREKARFFFSQVVLDTSILPLASKIKVAMAVAQQQRFKLDHTALQGIMAIRNAFAHQPTNFHPLFLVGKTPGRDQLHYTLKVISASGRLTHKKRGEALSEFDSHYEVATASLVSLLELLRASNGST